MGDMRGVGAIAGWQLTVEPSDSDDWLAEWLSPDISTNYSLQLWKTDSTFTNILSTAVDMTISNAIVIPKDVRSYYFIRCNSVEKDFITHINLGQVAGQSFGIHILGMTNGASDGWDGSQVDALSYPDAIIGRAWFEINEVLPFDKLSRDMRLYSNKETWNLSVEPSADADWLAQWSVSNMPWETHLYWEETESNYVTVIGPPLDMTITNDIIIPKDQKNYYRIRLVPEPLGASIIFALYFCVILNRKCKRFDKHFS